MRAFLVVALVLACLASAQAQVRLIERLSNGSQVFVERIEGSTAVSVQLWISAKGTEESPATNGWRHLVEHFMAKRLDQFTDEQGIFLSAETSREAMSFKFEAPPEKLNACLDGVRMLFEPLRLDADAIAKEIKLIRHEEAGLGVARRFSRAGWAQAFENSRPDPVGDFGAMALASPEALAGLQRRMLAADNVVITVCGALEPSRVIPGFRGLASSLLSSSELPKYAAPTATPEGFVSYSPQSVGSALCFKLEGIDRASSLARVALGLAVTQAYPDVQPLYTISAKPGLLTLASSRPSVWEIVQNVSDRQIAAGPALLNRWLSDIGRSPTRLAALRGALLCEGSGLTLEMIQLAASPIGLEDMLRARQEAMTAHKVEGFR